MSIDKSKEVISSIILVNDKLQFKGEIENSEPILIDYILPFGDNLGYTSLELFLLSLSSCVGSAILVILRKIKKNINSFKIKSKGILKSEHPTGIKSINIIIKLKTSTIIASDEMDKALKMAEQICPVLSMIKEQVVITINPIII